jgi:teichuronic acid biosynthesis glycosyltransferase TuaG
MISIILTLYNNSQYLHKALASCLIQDVPVEIIVVNDCSPEPPSGYVSDLIALTTDKYIFNDKNLGLAGARNVGIKASHHPYILPLDGDDWLYPNVLGHMLKAIKGNDVVFGNLTMDDDTIHLPPGKDGVTKEGLLIDNMVWGTSLFRKETLERVGLYDEYPFSNYEDYRLIIKLFMSGAKFKYIDRVIYRHTTTPGSMLTGLHSRTEYWKKFAQELLL